MSTLDERYVIDKNGERIGVLLDIGEYRRLMEELEELESIRPPCRASARRVPLIVDRLTRNRAGSARRKASYDSRPNPG